MSKKLVTFRFYRPGHYSEFIKRIYFSYQLNTVSLVVITLACDAIGPEFDPGWMLQRFLQKNSCGNILFLYERSFALAGKFVVKHSSAFDAEKYDKFCDNTMG